MPYQLTPELRGVYKHFWGHVSSEEFLAAVLQNHQRKDYDESVYSINDFSGVTSHSLDTQSLHKAAAHSLGAWYSNPDVLVLVVTRDSGICDLATRFGNLTHYQVECFETLAEARRRLESHHPERQGRVSGWGTLNHGRAPVTTF